MTKVIAGVSVNPDNLLKVSFNNDSFNMDELLEILASYRLKRRYHRLKDGTFISLGEQQLGALADFVESAGLKAGSEDTVELPPIRAIIEPSASQAGVTSVELPPIQPVASARSAAAEARSAETVELPPIHPVR